MLAFPGPGLGWAAWFLLVPGLLVIAAAGDGRAAACRGWGFGAGYLLAALHWTVPNIGPGLLLVAAVFGALWAGWGFLAWSSLGGPAVVALAAVPGGWVLVEYARSWAALGGPWALLGASQWRYPAVLDLAALGGVWLVSAVLVAVNTALALAVLRRGPLLLAVAAALVAAGPIVHAVRADPPVQRTRTVALVQPGVIHGPSARFDAGERITAGLPPVDLVVWGESSVGFDLARRPDLTARLSRLAARGALLVNTDAADVHGRIAKRSVLIGPDGPRADYVKTRLVPFGEYIPARPLLGGLAAISEAAERDRVPGTGASVMTADGTVLGPLICFESAFPDLGRAVVRRGAEVVVYQSATSTFQQSWAPAQHASLGAVRAAETGRPVVQAALTGVSAAFDARGRRLAWAGTERRGAVVVRLEVPPATGRTPYVRYGDFVPALAVVGVALGLWRPGRQGPRSLPPGTSGFLPWVRDGHPDTARRRR
ncbi:apolipoprotein N-acyltransferase [Actinomadura craniellae]|uniref:apolipoprotein N-acyltransferase n=1 Tax=Actinomadura craniellae TaxID=2231787 RepID=UPI001313F8D9|nr:apolipoprotein N-acyltransferase [Actinomadura craniellae]